ncbi:Radical SAM superfamily enzyme YgiQ [Dehalogenimonas formicexedens]|uniref:Radical SAM superfamily enzyme YgiQ n=1 Tax=Dehalogenimonas formicexedens TaxID=1839801 RepID=A0A1P8F8A1_9CHLR|nr:radical SAM protein [Dehalogenimonas formicexedens]APV44706.1 Radical SAM superfamily enzyme YgiQ [Dehalogenimonas formicexedens]
MKILLINAKPQPDNEPYKKAYTTLPNGILYIASVLEKAGHEVRVCDGFIDGRRPEDFVDWQPRIIGFSVIGGPYMEAAMAQSARFKELLPDCAIVWGNVTPSAIPEQVLAEPYVDFVVIGAGEFTMVELAASFETGSIELSDIKGLGYKLDGNAVLNERRPFIKNLDDLPDPAWHLVDMKKYTEIGLTTSRGCAFQCAYCYHSSLSKGYTAEFSAERVILQIEYVHSQYGARFVSFFNEDNFTFNRKRLREFCRLMIERKIKVKWSCDSRADLSEADIALMAKAGCVTIRFGLETGSQRMLDFLHKGITLADMERTVALLVKHRIHTLVYIMYGFPTETVADFQATQELLKRMDNPPHLFSRFVPFPGSALSDYCVSHKLVVFPEKLGDWPDFLTAHGHRINLSQVPDNMIAETAARWRHNYAKDRFIFTMKHYPVEFWRMVANPVKFSRELAGLLRRYFQLNRFNESVMHQRNLSPNQSSRLAKEVTIS